MSRNTFQRIIDSSRHFAIAAVFALFATLGLSSHAFAQKGGDGQLFNETTWPQSFTLTVGGAANDNWQKSGTYSIDGLSYDQSHGLANPNFSLGMEIPMLPNTMLVIRGEYNDYSLQFDEAVGGGAPLVVSLLTVGGDAMVKYSFNNFHVMAGAGLMTPVNATYAHSDQIEDATHSTATIPSEEHILGNLIGGVGYDIPVNGANTIWFTPEAFYTYALNSATQIPGNVLKVATVSGGASLKFAF